MLIEIHMLKNFPATNLNRDDTGAPKNCIFGGVQRGRISSQCLKRSWRNSDTFHELESFGIRTRNMPAIVGKNGVELQMPISLDGNEALALKASADMLKKIAKGLGLELKLSFE